MARTRSIKPGFFDNDILGSLPPLTRLLFIGLWTLADREGRLEDNPRKIKKVILGYDDVNAGEVNDMLQSLHDNDFIIRYKASGADYIQVTTFVKHQNPHIKEKGSEIPPPANVPPPAQPPENPDEWQENGEDEENTGQAPYKHQTGTVQAQPITDYLLPTPDYGLPTPSTGDPPAEEEDEEPPSGNGKPQNTLERRFELFWTAYPKKKAKKTAWAAFKKAKPDEKLFTRIMDAIGRARVSTEWQRENGQYIPNPATWLNGGCWDDEYKEASANGEHGGHTEPNNKQPPGAGPPGTGKPALAGFKPADDD